MPKHKSIAIALMFVCTGFEDEQPLVKEVRWKSIVADAKVYVSLESPSSAFPFETAKPGLGKALIVAHYFPPFPISLDNKPSSRDYYSLNYLSPEGESGKFIANGGFIRERPLAVSPYNDQTFIIRNMAIDVARAARIGIDAFGVDVLTIKSGVTWRRTLMLLDVAAHSRLNFRVIPELDMVSLAGESLESIADALSRFAVHPASYRVSDGRLLVMPFAAERRNSNFWRELSARMIERGTPIALAPDYVDSQDLNDNASQSWAVTVWGGRDPESGKTGETLANRARLAGIRRWLMPISPQDARPKSSSFVEARNSEALRNQWMASITHEAAGAHLLTWNDYSETSELSPSSVSQFVFYDLSAYYISWLKGRREPTIKRDALFYVHRTQILDPAKRLPLTLSIKGGAVLSNEIELVAMLTAPGQIVITSGSRRLTTNVTKGVHSLRLPASSGTPHFELYRGGKPVVQLTSHINIAASPSRHDATYGGGSSTRLVKR